jgi:hypothetical protein
MPSRSLPGWAASDLAELYAGDLERLSRRYAGHTDWWRFTGERLAAGDPDEMFSYPLYAGPLWRDWVAAAHPEADPETWLPPLLSGPLPTVRRD